jgi:hypothetical protein
MNGTGSLIYRAATEADVLAWLNADYRIRSGLDPEVDSGTILRPETTIAEWRSICDLVSPWRLSNMMHSWFDVARPASEWKAILEPEGERTLADLARFAAPYMRVPESRPIRVAGVADASSGAFFCLRGLLAKAGVPVEKIRPSTGIESLDRAYVLALSDALAKLAPEVTPEPRIFPRPRQHLGGLLALVGFVLLLASSVRSSPNGIGVAVALVLTGALLSSGSPAAVRFGSYSTFGDLARAIADRRQPAT